MERGLRFTLLGKSRATVDGAPLTGFVYRKSLALLFYLAVTGGLHTREALAGLLWGEATEANARASLRKILADLRRHVAPYLRVTRDDVALNPEASCWLDVAELGRSLGRAAGLRAGNLTAEEATSLGESIGLYQGDFLEGFSVRSAAAFEEWVLLEREHQRLLVWQALHALTEFYLARGSYAEAILYAERLLELEPAQEEAHRQIMQALALSGERGAALRQFEYCRDILFQELGAQPSPGTMSLYERIRTGRLDHPLASRENPYKGLQPFQEADRLSFFGREAFVARLVQAVRRQSVVAVIGPSGCGKSSAVLAGLVPALREKESWNVLHFRPGADPFSQLADALCGLPDPDGLAHSALPHSSRANPERRSETLALAHGLRHGDTTLRDHIQQHQRRTGLTGRWLLVADQLEDLYTLIPDPQGRHRFLDLLLEVVDGQESEDGGLSPPVLILCLRADFVSQALAYRRLASALQANHLMLGPMDRHEMRRAIEMPARRLGATFEAGLVSRLLDDVGEEPGNLPLLEFALTQLWNRQVDGYLTHGAYEKIGQVAGALAAYAESIYAGFDPAQQSQARRVLLELVRSGEGTQDIRRVARRRDMDENSWAMAQRLANARLTVTGLDPSGEETVEIVHEALIQHWERLRTWIDEDRAFRIWQERLRASLSLWQASRQDEGALLRGVPLAEAERWLGLRAGEVSGPARRFLQASLEHREKQEDEKDARQQRELALTRSLAEAEHRRAETAIRGAWRLRWTLGALGIALALAVAAVVLSIGQWRGAEQQASAAVTAQAMAETAASQAQHQASAALTAQAVTETERTQAEQEASAARAALSVAESGRTRAEQEAREALFRELGSRAAGLQAEQLDLALLLSVEAVRLADSREDRTEYMLALELSPFLDTFLHGHSSAIQSLAFSPDGRILASGSAGGTILLWDTVAHRALSTPLNAHGAEVSSLAFSPNGHLLATGSVDGTVILWDLSVLHSADALITGLVTIQPLGPSLSGHKSRVASLSFAEDGLSLISMSDDGVVLRWPLAGEVVGPGEQLLAANGQVGMAVSPDGTTVATRTGAEALVSDVSPDRRSVRALTGHTAEIQSMTFSSDGTKLASSSLDQTARLWDVATGQPLCDPLAGHEGRVLVSAFSPSGAILATGGADAAIVLWDVAACQRVAPSLTGHGDWVRQLVFSPDGRWLASGSADGTIIVWDLEPRRVLTGHDQQVQSLAFSPDGQTLYSAGSDRVIHRWDTSTGDSLPPPLVGHTRPVLNLAPSPDGSRLASAGEGGEVILWDLRTGQPTATKLSGHEGPVTAVAFSPDGQALATGDEEGSIILWDASTAKSFAALEGPGFRVLALAFGPDGRILASASSDGTIRFWDVVSRQALGEPLSDHDDWVTSLAFSPDGEILASGSADRTIRLWSISAALAGGATGSAVALPAQLGSPLTGHKAEIRSLVFRPPTAAEPQALISVDAGGSILQWDVDSQEPLGPPLITHVETESIAASPDGRTVALAGFDHTMSLWELNEARWPDRACRIANRNLTPEEWQVYFEGETYHQTCPEQ